MADFTFPWGSPEPKPKDGIYFTSKNSELDELQEELESMKIPRQKEAMKEIIAGMTIGKDVCPLFPYVVNCMRTKDVELKKLIYLYIINFAKAKPSESILAVNSFLVDAADPKSPMIRALSIRTMGCIRVDEIVSYLCDTLKNGLRDPDAYVKKTSCICVAKLFCTCPQLVKDNGLIDTLISMLDDGNAIVLASAIVALSEISLLSGENYLKINSKTLKRILNALNEANEWGQVYILDCLVNYKKKKTKYAEMIIEAAVPLFSHLNPAVIMSAVKVVLKYLDHIEDEKKVQNYSKKISMCLVSLMDSVPEMKYLLLRAMHCIIQKRHYLLDKDYRAFFIKAYEPIYVKFEKLDILYKLTDNMNYEMILNELKSYSMLEYDLELVQRTIKYIGNIGFKFEKAMSLCVDCISQILNFNQDFTIDQSVIVMRDLLRKYNNEKKPKELLKKIDEKLIDKIRLPESKAAILYILGEYAKKIENSTDLITLFYNDFKDENEKVKLQILNACIKNYLIKPDDKKAEDLVKSILQQGGEETVNPDVRDRAYIYWRLLENDPNVAKDMILAEKPSFDSIEEQPIDQELCDDILINITNMSCIYHKKCTDMLRKEDLLYEKEEDSQISTASEKEEEKKKPRKNKINKDQVNINDVDLLGLGDFTSMNTSTAHPQQENNNGTVMDIFSGEKKDTFDNDIEFLDDEGTQPSTSSIQDVVIFENNDNCVSISKPALCFKPTDKAKDGTCGVAIFAQFNRENGNIMLGLNIQNHINSALKNFNIEIPPNSFCLFYSENDNQHVKDFTVNSEAKKNLIVKLNIYNNNNNKQPPSTPCVINVIVKTNIDDFIIQVPLYVNVLFSENGKMDRQSFASLFKETCKQKKTTTYSKNLKITSEDMLNQLFEKNHIFNVARNMKLNPPSYYYTCSISNVIQAIIEVSYQTEEKTNFKTVNVSVMTKIEQVSPLLKEFIDLIMVN